MKIIISLAYMLITVKTVFSESNYCTLKSCPNQSHTLCKYKESGISKKCGKTQDFELGQDDINTIVELHNDLGDEPFTTEENKQVSAPFVWDEELARIAQRWANQCEKGTDKCRNVEQFNVTQQIGSNEVYVYEGDPEISPIILNWFSQNVIPVKFERFNLENLSVIAEDDAENLSDESVEEKITKIGCGVVIKVRAINKKLILVCNYGPV